MSYQLILFLLYSGYQNDTSYKIQIYKYPTLNITKHPGLYPIDMQEMM